MDQEKLIAGFIACLLTKEEAMGVEASETLPDLFPTWKLDNLEE